eukprot:m.194807 g.194807  ORF g.194807 m.194807 type:complete len:297 (+) comp15682_c0_seq1:203-1093(+)
MRVSKVPMTILVLAFVLTSANCKFNKSILFEKLTKVGGSTFGGVVRRIGRKYNLSGIYDGWLRKLSHRTLPPEPFVFANHGEVPKVKGQQFKILLVRAPDERQISAFYHFSVSLKNISDSEDEMLKNVKHMDNDYLCAMKEPTREKLEKEYDFIGITERFEESVLLLKYLLPNLTVRDLLYINSKDSSKVFTPNSKEVFTPHAKDVTGLPPKVREYFASEEFKSASKCQWEIWRIANQIMNEHIVKIQNFSLELLEFRRMIHKADRECYTTEWNDCFWKDNGCAIHCLDNLDLNSY